MTTAVDVVDTRSLRRSVSRRAVAGVKAAAILPALPALYAAKSMSKMASQSFKRLSMSKSKGAKTLEGPTPPATPSDSSSGSPGAEADDVETSGLTAEVRDLDSALTAGEVPTPAKSPTLEVAANLAARLAPTPTAAAPPPPPPLVELAILKHGAPWRGTYSRTVVIGGGRIVTLDPQSRAETNAWEVPRDAPRAVAKTHANGATVELQVAPWPQAPEWLHQRFRCSAIGRAEGHAMLAALKAAGVAVESME